MIQSKEWWAIQKFGKLRLKDPVDMNTGSHRKIEFVCECGNSKQIVVKDVIDGKTRSCGKCKLTSRKKIGSNHKCKSEIQAKIEELNELIASGLPEDISSRLNRRINDLTQEMKTANEDIMSAAISSHHVMCAVKNMKPNEAFGNDPFIYYALGLVGEAGELTGALLRAIRNGDTPEGKKVAVESELADCIIYAVILAYTTGIDLVKIVNDKARIVESRARAGYYGPPLR